jgi:hypothetical protein
MALPSVRRKSPAWLPPAAAAVLVLALVGCDCRPHHPPAARHAGALGAFRSARLQQLIDRNEPLLSADTAASRLPRLDATLAIVARRFGASSAEMEVALTDTGVLLITHGDRFDLALPYFERALTAGRAALGPEHPELGFALSDLAYVRYHVAPERFRSDVEPMMEEAIALRRRVLGPDAPETAGSQRQLAGMLLGFWQTHGGGDPDSSDLHTASELVNHALPVLQAAVGKEKAEVSQLRHLQVEIALARGEFAAADALALGLMEDGDAACFGWSDLDARQLRVLALLGLGRTADADVLAKSVEGGTCGEWVRQLLSGRR